LTFSPKERIIYVQFLTIGDRIERCSHIHCFKVCLFIGNGTWTRIVDHCVPYSYPTFLVQILLSG